MTNTDTRAQALEAVKNGMELMREGSLNLTHCKLLLALHEEDIIKALQQPDLEEIVAKIEAEKRCAEMPKLPEGDDQETIKKRLDIGLSNIDRMISNQTHNTMADKAIQIIRDVTEGRE